MTLKPNPGCAIPEIPKLPGVDEFFKKLADAEAVKKLKTPAVIKAEQVKATLESKAAEIQAAIDRAKKYEELAENFTKIYCPLPQVPDKTATTKTS